VSGFGENFRPARRGTTTPLDRPASPGGCLRRSSAPGCVRVCVVRGGWNRLGPPLPRRPGPSRGALPRPDGWDGPGPVHRAELAALPSGDGSRWSWNTGDVTPPEPFLAANVYSAVETLSWEAHSRRGATPAIHVRLVRW